MCCGWSNGFVIQWLIDEWMGNERSVFIVVEIHLNSYYMEKHLSVSKSCSKNRGWF